MPELTPELRKLRSQLAAHESWAKTEDRSARTAKARRALEAKFLAEAGGDPLKANHLRKAHFARMALKSAQVRSRKAAVRSKIAELDAPAGGDLDGVA